MSRSPRPSISACQRASSSNSVTTTPRIFRTRVVGTPHRSLEKAAGKPATTIIPDWITDSVPFTRNHRVIANFLYQTSGHTGNKYLDQLYGGWELAGRMLFQTGPYLTVTAPGTDPSGTNFDNSYNGGDPRADIVSGVPIYPQNQNGSPRDRLWVNKAAFALPPDQHRPVRQFTGRLGGRARHASSFALASIGPSVIKSASL